MATNSTNSASGPEPARAPEVDFAALRPGQTVGRYEIVSVLGQGGFGITYRARDVQLGREVAIKEYLPSALAFRQDGETVLPRTTKLADDFGWGRERFVSEGRTLATLHRAPAIVHVFDFLEANGTAYIVMELLNGETLEDRLKRVGKLGPEDIDRILWPLLDGLEQVHDAGFLHRDIKPANILVDAAGYPTLIDFGASRVAMAGRTAAMTAIFTPGYAAVEQMTSAKQGPPTDIYGLSATLYHAITGKVPPSAFDRVLDDTYEPLAGLKPPGFAPGLLAGIDAGLAAAARDRPQSIAGWRPILGMAAAPADDATVVMGKSVAPVRQAPTVSGGPPPVVVPRRRIGFLVAAAVALSALLAGGGYYFVTASLASKQAAQEAAAAAAADEHRKADEATAARQKALEDQKAQALQKAAAEKAEAQRKADAEEALRRQVAEETRRQIEAERVEQKRSEDEARRKAEADSAAKLQAEEAAKQKAAEEADARRKAIEEARKAVEFVAGDFDHFGATLMMIGLKGRPGEIRLQGVDIVDDPALRQLAVNALALQPRNIRCRQTDRLTDGTPLYRCLVTPLNAKEPLADVPDSDRTDLALALVRNGLVLASCDSPRSYADAEDEARSRNQSLWGRIKVSEYKRRCSR